MLPRLTTQRRAWFSGGFPMVSAVQSRPNYYELLGLTPAATDDEITNAFAKAMGMFGFHPVTVAAQLSAAFEILRNPAKRKDYDRSLGLAKEPESVPQPQPWAMAAQRGGTPFFGLARSVPPAQSQAEPALPVAREPRTDPLHRPASPAEPRVAPFIAAALRESPKAAAPEPAPQPAPQPDPMPRPEPKVEPTTEPRIEDILAAARAAIPAETDERPVAWQRPALVIGGVILAVGLVGGLAGMSAGGDAADSQQNEAKVTVAVPAAKAVAPPEALPAGHFEAVSQPGHAAVANSRNIRHRSSVQPRAFEKSALDGIESAISQPEASPGVDASVEQASAEAPAIEPVAAGLPLPKRVIARTIDRIGYACGSVVSATAVEGADGVYKINCTSGQSYQASPVRGRYHFRRLGRN